MLTLLNCEGLPPPRDGGDTLVLLPTVAVDKLNDVSYGSFGVTIVSRTPPGTATRLFVDPARSYQAVSGLPEGEYTLDRVTLYYHGVPDNRFAGTLGVSFKTHSGRITIINGEFELRTSGSGPRKVLRYYWKDNGISLPTARAILTRLKEEKNYRLWQLADETRNIPQIQSLLEEQGSRP